MKKYLSVFILIIVASSALQSCHFGTSGTWKDDHIDPAVRAEIAPLDKKLFNGIMAKDVEAVRSLLAPVLLEKTGKKIDTLVNDFGDAFKADGYEELNSFYTKNTTTNISNTVFSGLGDSDYSVSYLALNEEMYVSVMVSKKLPINCMVLAIYGKYTDGWKINILQMGEYSILGKTAPDYYDMAKGYYKKGNVIKAASEIIMASKVAAPGGSHFKYKNDDDMKAFYTQTISQVNTQYKFPVTLNNVPNRAQVLTINPTFISVGQDAGIYPVVDYLTTVSLKDTVTLKKQNQSVQKEIGKAFKGIDEDTKYILYRVSDIFPDGKKPVNFHKFTQKLN